MFDYNILYLILGGAVAALILIYILFGLLRRRKLRKLGIDGEKAVAKKLKSFARIRGFKVINDLYLPLYDKTTQIDHILIGFFGLLVIETKNVKGEIYGDGTKKDWVHIVGGAKHTLYNPLMQNQAHIDCIRHVLGQQNIYSVNIESLVVFTNKKLSLNVSNTLPVIMLKRLGKYLHNPRFEKDNDFDVQAINDALLNARVTDKKLLADHNKNVKKAAKENK